MAYRKTRSLCCCSVICKRLYSVFSSQMMVNGSEFRLIQLPCFLLAAQFNSLHPWTERNFSQLGTPQISFHWWNTTNSQQSECTEHIIMVSRESSCNNCTEFVVGLKILLHYSINSSHRCQCHTSFRLSPIFCKINCLYFWQTFLWTVFWNCAKHSLVPYVEMCRKNDPFERTISDLHACDITECRYYIHKLTYKVLY